MKASEFLKRYEQKQKERAKGEQPSEEDHSLEAQAKERAKHPEQMNVGTPFDWEELEAYQKELDRLDREGPGAHKEKDGKSEQSGNSGKSDSSGKKD